jgi:type II secretory pathway pseudopilin PulG
MSSETILIILGVLALVSVVYEVWRQTKRRKAKQRTWLRIAAQNGARDAIYGLGRDDYPIDYTDAEREAWQRGWDEYHERS